MLSALFVCIGMTSQAFTPADSVNACTSLATKKILHLQTIWSGSSNAASLNYFECGDRIGDAYVYSDFSEGDYHLFQRGESVRKVGFFTDGYVQLNNWKFYGSFDYYNQLNKDVKWVDVMDPYCGNPYTLGDSIGGNYTKEYFNMEGKMSYLVSDHTSMGLDVKYVAGVGAKRKDPRPKNIVTTFDISPGILFNLNKMKIGANFRYEGSKEDIEITTVTENTYDIFYFKGLGVYTSTTEYDDWSSESDLLGGGLQFNFDGHSWSNLTEVNINKKSTDIKRGTTYPLQIVLLERFNTDVSSIFQFSTDEKKVKKLKLFFRDVRSYGNEPVVEPKLEQVTYQWSTAAKYTIYWDERQEYGLDYSYYKIIDKHHINWGGKLAAKVNSSETTYYFVPEYNRQKLNCYELDATLEKGFQFRASEILLSLDGGYHDSFDSSLEFVEESTLLETVNTEFVTNDFNYYSAGLWKFGASAKIGKVMSLYQSPVQVFFDAGYQLLVADLDGKPKWNNFQIKLGMNF